MPVTKAFELAKLVDLTDIVTVANIGAAAIGERPVYEDVVQCGLAHLYAVDGDPRQIPAIKARYASNASVINHFLGDGQTHKVHLCHPETGMTSLFEPNQAALDFFNGFPQFGEVIGTEEVSTKRLDDIDDVPQIDFLKMDVQGAELSILQNGIEKLSDCIAVQLEVSFICLYKDQPSFGEVDVWMRSAGFVPHRFLDTKCWSIAPLVRNNDFRKPFHQLLEADIVYIKNPLDPDRYTARQLKHLFLMAELFFASPDLAVFALRALVLRDILPESVLQDFLKLR